MPLLGPLLNDDQERIFSVCVMFSINSERDSDLPLGCDEHEKVNRLKRNKECFCEMAILVIHRVKVNSFCEFQMCIKPTVLCSLKVVRWHNG